MIDEPTGTPSGTIQRHNPDVGGPAVAQLASELPGQTPITRPIESAIAAMVRTNWTNERIVDFLASNRHVFISEGDVKRVRAIVPTADVLDKTYLTERTAGATSEVDVMHKMAQTLHIQEERLSSALLTEERLAGAGVGDADLLVPGRPGTVRRVADPANGAGQANGAGSAQAAGLPMRPHRRGGFGAVVNELVDSYWTMLTQYTRSAQSMGKLPTHGGAKQNSGDNGAGSGLGDMHEQLVSLRTLNLQTNVTINQAQPTQSTQIGPAPTVDIPAPEQEPIDVVDGSFTVSDIVQGPAQVSLPEQSAFVSRHTDAGSPSSISVALPKLPLPMLEPIDIGPNDNDNDGDFEEDLNAFLDEL